MSQPQGRAQKESFQAWLDTMPPSRNILHVKGDVEYSGGGWSAELVPATSQGINPAILILELSEKREGIETRPIQTVEVKYKRPDSSEYRQVTIRSASPDFTLDVKTTS